MKILIICHEFPPVGGGTANAVFYLAKCLKDKEHEVTVITSRLKKASQGQYDFNVVYLPVLRRHTDRTSPLELISFTVSGIIYGLAAVRKKKYDVCLAMHGIPSGWVAFVIYKLFKIPYIVSLRGADVPGFLPQQYDKLHRKVKSLTSLYWKNAKAIIANSEGLKELADVTADRIGKLVKVIPNGVDCRIFNPDYSLRDNQSIRIIYAGRLTLQKGLEGFIEAVRQAKDRIKNNFNVKIIGNGYLEGHLKNISVELCNVDIITFSDWVDKKTLIEEYKKAHIFILPSFYEGMSNSLLEAMACGCMAIASDIPGNRELVKNNENGVLFDPGNISKLEDTLVKVLNSGQGIIEEMGIKNRKIAENLDWAKAANSYLEELNTAITPRQKASPACPEPLDFARDKLRRGVKAGMNGAGSGFARANPAIKDAAAVLRQVVRQAHHHLSHPERSRGAQDGSKDGERPSTSLRTLEVPSVIEGRSRTIKPWSFTKL